VTWDNRFLELARLISTWSKDPSSQVGCVIADDRHRVVSLGFNGFPRGIDDNNRLADRVTKHPIILHAEINAVVFAEKSIAGCTAYVMPFMPCTQCAAMLVQAGIVRVVAPWCDDDDLRNRWNMDAAVDLLIEGGIKVDTLVVERPQTENEE